MLKFPKYEAAGRAIMIAAPDNGFKLAPLSTFISLNLNVPIVNYLNKVGNIIVGYSYVRESKTSKAAELLQETIATSLRNTVMTTTSALLNDVTRLSRTGQIRDVTSQMSLFSKASAALPASFHSNFITTLSQLPAQPAYTSIRQQLSAAANAVRANIFVSTTAPANTPPVDSTISPFQL